MTIGIGGVGGMVQFLIEGIAKLTKGKTFSGPF